MAVGSKLSLRLLNLINSYVIECVVFDVLPFFFASLTGA